MSNVRVIYILVAGLIAAPLCLAEEPLGRLFFSPAQRSALDAGKYIAAPTHDVVPPPRTVHLTGVVTRSDAENTVWINGKVYHDASPDGVQVKTDRSAPASTAIRAQGKSAATRVKVGQQLDLNSGRIQEDFMRRPAATESPASPAGESAARAAIAKTSKSAGDSGPLVPQVGNSEKRGAGAANDSGKVAPATVR